MVLPPELLSRIIFLKRSLTTARSFSPFMSRLPAYQFDGRRIRSMRGDKSPVDPYLPYGWFNEQELDLHGNVIDVSAILLTNRECPFTCLMCDLWKHTTDETL